MRASLVAFLAGLRLVLWSPGLLVGLYALVLIALAPFAFTFARSVDRSLSGVDLPAAAERRLDASTWERFAAQARGVASSFTPSIIGLAAPVGSVASLLDGTLPPTVVLSATAAVVALWTFVLPGIITRLVHRPSTDSESVVTIGMRHFLPLLALTVLAMLIVVSIVLVQPWLLRTVDQTFAASAAERPRFLWRLSAYLLTICVLFAVTVLLDISRLAVVLERRNPVAALRRAFSFVRARAIALITLGVLYGCCWSAGMAAYALADLAWGGELGLWRVIVIGQLYILGRLSLRLAYLAAQIRLLTCAQ